MTPKYWFRIVLGMLAIFAAGMLVRSAAHKGKTMVDDIAHGSGPITVPLLGMPFRLGGAEIGSLQRLRIERSAPKMIAGFHLYATVEDSVAADRFSDCRLTVTDANNIDEHTSFSCATADDSARQSLVPFGTVRLAPSGRELVLLIPDSVRRDIQKDGQMRGDSGGNGDSVDIAGDSGDVEIKINGKSVFSMKGDSTGLRMTAHDDSGKEVVNMRVTVPPKPAAVKRP
ncbi:MAG: hypothetical protein V4503_04015 [Gemmatimonadota bacterium]